VLPRHFELIDAPHVAAPAAGGETPAAPTQPAITKELPTPAVPSSVVENNYFLLEKFYTMVRRQRLIDR
jgi:hypothetical protein